MSSLKITIEELSKHNTKDDLWIAVNGLVYDVSIFQKTHPGTSGPLLHFAGKDATSGFDKVHKDLVISKYLEESKLMGILET